MPAANIFCNCVISGILEFRGYVNPPRGRAGGWWSFFGVGCYLLLAVFKEETRRKKLG